MHFIINYQTCTYSTLLPCSKSAFTTRSPLSDQRPVDGRRIASSDHSTRQVDAAVDVNDDVHRQNDHDGRDDHPKIAASAGTHPLGKQHTELIAVLPVAVLC